MMTIRNHEEAATLSARHVCGQHGRGERRARRSPCPGPRGIPGLEVWPLAGLVFEVWVYKKGMKVRVSVEVSSPTLSLFVAVNWEHDTDKPGADG